MKQKEEPRIIHLHLPVREARDYHLVGFWLTMGVAFGLSAIYVAVWVMTFLLGKI